MMLCVDKNTLHDSLPDQDSGQPRAAAQAGDRGARDQPREGQAGPAPAGDQNRRDQHRRDQHRREVLVRVVLISEALNQRLAL
ncbi:MAG: hypothetical protein JWL68_1726 [Actinomycetia bacterium]|nr:hypothetical protein [Actinomycetes bacterium]